MAKTKKQTESVIPEEPISQPLPIDLDVRINSIIPNGSGKLRATGSVNMNGCFAVRGVKIYEGTNGLFVNMPSYKGANDKYKEYCHPITKEFREQLNNAVLDAYNQAVRLGNLRPTEHEPSDPASAQPMKVDVRITALTPGNTNQRASATVNLNDSFALKGVKVMEGSNGLFVHTPRYKAGEKYNEHYFPVTKEFREQFHNAVLTAYDEAIAQSQGASEQDYSDYSEEPQFVQSM